MRISGCSAGSRTIRCLIIIMCLLLISVHAPGATLPSDDREFLMKVARDTWRYFDECRDPQTLLIWDHAGDDPDRRKGEYTSITNIGMDISCAIVAGDLGLIDKDDAAERVLTLLQAAESLERDNGLFYNFYETRTRRPTNNFVSFVDNGWFGLSLIAARQAFPEKVGAIATRLLDAGDYGRFYCPERGVMSHGYRSDTGGKSHLYYDHLVTEPRAASLLAIGKGDVPKEHWFRMTRTPEAQGRGYRDGEVRSYDGLPVWHGVYIYRGIELVPSWGGSMFEFLMPPLFIDEAGLAPLSLGENNRRAVEAQIAHAKVLDLPVWGMSPCAVPGGGYGEYGVEPIGIKGYSSKAVTPHAAFLALEISPDQTISNLREMAERYDIYGRFGFRDSVDPRSGQVSDVYLALDQGMILLAIGNYLTDGAFRKRIMSDPVMDNIGELIGKERFFGTDDD